MVSSGNTILASTWQQMKAKWLYFFFVLLHLEPFGFYPHQCTHLKFCTVALEMRLQKQKFANWSWWVISCITSRWVCWPKKFVWDCNETKYCKLEHFQVCNIRQNCPFNWLIQTLFELTHILLLCAINYWIHIFFN